jgi:hypothetical protein
LKGEIPSPSRNAWERFGSNQVVDQYMEVLFPPMVSAFVK